MTSPSAVTTFTGTVAELKSRGVAFTQDVADHGYGLVTYFTAPGGVTVQLYQPRHKKRSTRSRPKPGREPTAKAGKGRSRRKRR